MHRKQAANLLRDNGFTVARSSVPACRNATDITIEQTINRSAKTPGGIIGFSRQPAAYHRWCLTRHSRAQYVDAVMDRVSIATHTDSVHKSTRLSEIRKGMADVTKLQSAFGQFSSPLSYKDTGEGLYCLSSGLPASPDVAQDLLRYTEIGQSAADTFITSRLIDRSVEFHSSMHKQNLKTFSSMAVKKVSSVKQKNIRMKAERNLLGTILVLSQKHDIDLEKVFQYPLSPITWALATGDGGLMKTDKSQLLHHLEAKVSAAADQELTFAAEDVVIVEANAVYQTIVKAPPTFGELALHIFHARIPKVNVLHFVTDTYVSNSIKDFERERRGTSASFKIGGPKTTTPHDWKSFLHSSSNKTQLTDFLLAEWKTDQFAKHLQGRKLFFVNRQTCHCLTSDDGVHVICIDVPELHSSQHEADTRIILHCLHADRSCQEPCTIVVSSPDTDVFVLLLYYAKDIKKSLLFQTGSGNKRRLIDVQAVVNAVGDNTIQALHGTYIDRSMVKLCLRCLMEIRMLEVM